MLDVAADEVPPNEFAIKFEGGVADSHSLSAKELSDSLDGVEKIISSFLAALTTHSVSQRRLKEPGVQVLVRAPRQGSMEVVLVVQQIAAVALPIYPFLRDAAVTKVSEHLLSSVLLFFSRDKKASDTQMEKALDIIQDLATTFAEDRKLEREAVYADKRDEREFLKHLLTHQREALEPAAKKAVAPIGKSCTQMSIPNSGTEDATIIDEVAASAIRGESAMGSQLIDDDVSTFVVFLDGLRKSTRTLWGMVPEAEKAVQITVIDPAYEEGPNVYAEALSTGVAIILTGFAQRNFEGDVTRFFAKSGKLAQSDN